MAEPFGIVASAVGIAHETSRIAVGGLGRRVWKHLLIQTEVEPIARLQQYHLPPVVHDDISCPSENGKPRVQLHDDERRISGHRNGCVARELGGKIDLHEIAVRINKPAWSDVDDLEVS
jgi:hypothetical protein